MLKVGLDVGSTTIKCIVLDDNENIIYSDYKRHYSHIKDNIIEKINELREKKIIDKEACLAISGSAGMGIAEGCFIPFVQEVYATRVAANKLIPGTDCIIELGGEDAKILFLTDGMEVRMNGTCAGGTGAFIDQMATLLNVDITEINNLASEHQKLYSIASRCGVFAKSDIQPLLNQGAEPFIPLPYFVLEFFADSLGLRPFHFQFGGFFRNAGGDSVQLKALLRFVHRQDNAGRGQNEKGDLLKKGTHISSSSYRRLCPQSTGRITPVTDRFHARNSTAEVKSETDAGRFSGTRAAVFSMRERLPGGGIMLPGATAFTRIRGPHWRAAARVAEASIFFESA